MKEKSRPCPIKSSEGRVKRHFELSGFQMEYEPEVGGRRPDFRIWKENNALAYIEVENITSTPFVTGQVVAVDTATPFREKINCAVKQLKFCKELPCMIIVDAPNTMHTLDPKDIVEAMFGTEVFRVSHYSDGSIRHGMDRAKDGRMLQPGWSKAYNTTISAIGVWQYFIAQFELEGGHWHGEDLNLNSLPAWLQCLIGLDEEGDEEIKKSEGSFLRVGVRLLQILKNPEARIEWPNHIASPYDSFYTVDDRRLRPIRTLHGPSTMGVPKEAIDQDFETHDEWWDGPKSD